jgi:hypothetical protein
MKRALLLMVFASSPLMLACGGQGDINVQSNKDRIIVRDEGSTGKPQNAVRSALYAEPTDWGWCGDINPAESIPPGDSCFCTDGRTVECGNTTHDCRATSLQTACKNP